MSSADGPEDLVDGIVGRQRAVEDVELALETLGDVVTTTPGLDHGGQELDVDDVGELTGFLQAVKTPHGHQLTHNLVCDLVNES